MKTFVDLWNIPANTIMDKDDCVIFKKLYHRTNKGRCLKCGKFTKLLSLTIEHILAKCNGGTDHANNLTIWCFDCNTKKSHLDHAKKLSTKKDWSTTKQVKGVKLEYLNAVNFVKFNKDYFIKNYIPFTTLELDDSLIITSFQHKSGTGFNSRVKLQLNNIEYVTNFKNLKRYVDESLFLKMKKMRAERKINPIILSSKS